MYPILAENNQIIGGTSIVPPSYEGPEIPEGFNIRSDDEEAAFYENGKFVRRSIFDLIIYKTRKLEYISSLCYMEMHKLLPMAKQINVMIGATEGYPEYLKGEKGRKNIAKFIEIYKTQYHNMETLINDPSIDSKQKIDNAISSMKFPTQQEILEILNKDD